MPDDSKKQNLQSLSSPNLVQHTAPKNQKVIPVALTPGGSTKTKEQEPSSKARAEEDKLMAEIVSTSEVMRREALDKLEKELPEIKRQELKLPPDVEDAGVKIPEEDADKVIRDGTTLSLPVSEDAYKRGMHVKVGGKVEGTVGNKIVVGVSGIGALALWIGRLLKMAHKHAMKVIFRKE